MQENYTQSLPGKARPKTPPVALWKDIEKNVRGKLAMENPEFELSPDKYVCV